MLLCGARLVHLRIFSAVLLVLVQLGHAERYTGTWHTDDFFKFITKFGFQKTLHANQKDSYGYIFGNITLIGSAKEEPPSQYATLAVLDRGYFLQFYGNRTVQERNKACSRMFTRVSNVAFDGKCNPTGGDLLRRVPCPRGRLCPDEDQPWHVVRNYQFTYAIQDLSQPRFWFVSLVACFRNETSCKWEQTTKPMNMSYDIWLVNGNPNSSSLHNPFVYQFSFDKQNMVEMYLVLLVWYVILVPVQVYAACRQSHPVTRLFTISLLLQLLAFCLIVIHSVTFAMDGRGMHDLAVAGDILDILARTLFMLLLLLLAKGWAMTRMELTWKPLVFSIWFIYGLVHILLYVWNKTEVDVVEEIDEYQTWPGWLILTVRTSIMVWFVFELRNTMLYEHNTHKLNFFLHFGASSLVWFIYLPIVAIIALHISPLWRYKFLLGITYSADCVAYSVMTHLLWPSRSEQYFLLADQGNPYGDEMDVFNENPHEINHTYTPLSLNGSNPDLTKALIA